MNGHEYPNIPVKVGDGLGATDYLPYRCSSANFTEEAVYTWQHGMADNNNGKVTTMNMMNMQL